MVCEEVAIFQDIWEVTNQKQGQSSLWTIKRYLNHRKDIDMNWVNVRWGVFPNTYATHIFP
jgi:hypothetical protein